MSIKCVLLGNLNAGKTSLVVRFISNRFFTYTESTVGCVYNSYEYKYNSMTYKINIWDTAGQERYRTLIPMYYRDAMIVFICIDLSSRSIKEEFETWRKQLDIYNDNTERIVFIVGTKSDIREEESDDDIEEIIRDNKDIIYMKTSAKLNINIQEVFHRAFDICIYRMRNKREKIETNKITLEDNNIESRYWSYFKC